jgi:uncharacterized membrane protein YphA (DoxX/SURF4 family)
MKALWSRYLAFLHEQEAPQALALVRITFGLALTLNVLQQLVLDDPVKLYAEIEHGGIFGFTPNARDLTLFQFIPLTAAWVYAVLVTQLVAATCLASGLFTRAAAAVALVIQMTLQDRMVMFRYDGDNVFRVVCFLLVLAPAGACWSLDAWRGKGRATVDAWGRRLLVAQLAIIYTRTGVVKLGSSWSIMEDWKAVYLALNLPGIARYPGDWAAHPLIFPLTQVGTFVASWWEVLFFLLPLNMFLRRRPSDAYRWRLWRWLSRFDLRAPFLLTGVIMHGSLLVLTDVGLFSIVMMSLYPAYLLPAEAQRVLARLWRTSQV